MLQRALVFGIICKLLLTSGILDAQTGMMGGSNHKKLTLLNIPERSDKALIGSEFAIQITGLSIKEREEAIVREILSGNVPSFSRSLKTIRIQEKINSINYELVVYVACDYLAIGSNLDYLYIPMTPGIAQILADTLECSLPTAKLVDSIYNQADIKLHPQPIPPSDSMTTVPIFHQHTDSILYQYRSKGLERSGYKIVAGHKKDIILSNKIYDPDRTSGCVVIYGWHISEDQPIQPVYNGHVDWYADYSHGVRFVSKNAFLNGNPVLLDEILTDRVLSCLLSNEGVIETPFYPERTKIH